MKAATVAVKHFVKAKKGRLPMVEVRVVCAVLGLIIGILLALEIRLKGESMDSRVLATSMGIALGIVVGLAFFDIFEFIAKGVDHHEVMVEHKAILQRKPEIYVEQEEIQ
jgi:hydrogenase/urease accessory protein HupE